MHIMRHPLYRHMMHVERLEKVEQMKAIGHGAPTKGAGKKKKKK